MKRCQESRNPTRDRQEIRDRLGRASQALEDGRRLSAEQAQAVLEERSRKLACVPPQVPHNAEVFQVLIFSLGDERYGIATEHIHEVLRVQEITPLPGTPDFLAGIANMRGQILALFDLRRFFGMPIKNRTEDNQVVVLGRERAEFGVLADTVHEVLWLRTDEVLAPPSSMTGVVREFVRGVTEVALIVFDGDMLVKDSRLFINLPDASGVGPGA